MRFFSLQVSPRWKFLMAVLIITSISTYAFIRTEEIREEVETVWNRNNAKIQYVMEMRITLKSAMRSLDMMLQSGKVRTEDMQSFKSHLAHYDNLEGILSTALTQSKLTSRNEEAVLHKIKLDAGAAKKVLAGSEKMLLDGQFSELQSVLNRELKPGPLARWYSGLDEMLTLQNDSNTAAGSRASLEYEKLRTHVLLVCALIVILGLISLWQTIQRNAQVAKETE